MTLEPLLKEVTDNLDTCYDESILQSWYSKLATEFVWLSQQLGPVKRDRAKKEIEIKSQLLAENGKYTEDAIKHGFGFSSIPALKVYIPGLLICVNDVRKTSSIKRC